MAILICTKLNKPAKFVRLDYENTEFHQVRQRIASEGMQLKSYAMAHTDNHRSDAPPFLCSELQICQSLFPHQLSLKKEKTNTYKNK